MIEMSILSVNKRWYQK